MKKIQLLLLPVLLLAGAVYGQHKFKLGAGYQRTWMLDKQASPLKYQSSEKTFLLGYENAGNNGKFSAQLNGAFGAFFPTGFHDRKWYNPGYNNDGSPKKDSGLLLGTLYNARLKLGYVREISSGFSVVGKEKFYNRKYLGASLSNQLFYSDNIVRTGWMNSSSLNAEYAHDVYTQNRHLFTLRLTVPLFARNTRLPYHNTVGSSAGESHIKTIVRQGSRFATLLDFQNIAVEAGYEFAVNGKVGLGLQYSGQWLHYTYERPINLFQNNLSLVATIK